MSEHPFYSQALHGPYETFDLGAFALEAQYRYILEALAAGGGRPIDVRPDALAAFNARLREDLAGSSWAGSCISWYKTADGRIVNNWSGSVEDYRARTAHVELEHFETLEAAHV